jgi:geranylgeranyl diphosphate synthase type I
MNRELFVHTRSLQMQLRKFIQSHESDFQETSSWGKDVMERFASFASTGKMIRGNCLLVSFIICGGTNKETAITAAVAIELIHASLLIHDDIMDNDQFRRGEDSLFRQYQKLVKKKGIKNHEELGKSLAMCVGDIGFFLAIELLNNIAVTEQTKQKLIRKVSTELPLVGLGQMQDLINLRELSEESILQTYRYKTARYTFSLPFALGALLAQKEQYVEQFEKFGEILGIIFQLKDDELGMFGKEEEIGKKVGSDIREGKKTLYFFYLLQQVNSTEHKRLKTIWGNRKSNTKDLLFIHSLLKKYMIQENIYNIFKINISRVEKLLSKLPIDEENKNILREFIAYNEFRNK